MWTIISSETSFGHSQQISCWWKTIRLWWMWRKLCPRKSLDYAFSISWFIESICMFWLRGYFPSKVSIGKPRAYPWTCTTLVYSMWKGVFAKANIGRTYEVVYLKCISWKLLYNNNFYFALYWCIPIWISNIDCILEINRTPVLRVVKDSVQKLSLINTIELHMVD